MVKIAPSILSADFSKLGEDIKNLDKYGADVIHIDVMDGRFVPNISFGIPIIKSIRNLTDKPFDVHLMIEEPSKYIEDFVKAGADIISVHYEGDKHIDRTINYIKSLGIKAAVALNPGTSVSCIKDLIPSLDMVLIMSVNPGFGGQKYIQYASEKIKEVKVLSEKYNKDLIIEVDGGVTKDNIKEIADCGADLLVAGSAVFKNGEIEKNIKVLREAL
ncbi:ribulose-phosphate 3-epimerase [Clostridium botulinum]|uniref:Ribulose-phosphate 3-epimerase n=1 Tax=Clostridium botulinum (strain Hall / ATCC 3502 / NCTC 13319 / Type A) TaxID=441771 RepID=A5I4T0_CLOBH|nr:ribulose-phosphate 3-epimerase [Clostridium botulinum]ABS33215.1 ribulose-phosphate 3-epimerase [Clostridium botulinum A str. ATCC 19397]ABS38118.1 ribulose-phosphate 3-epimerase [Clostridium botulinum A str. Hall]APQ74943.1 ribulose-phosphate 3-epimerase [Clostridium botulinum]APQ96975.1 ribulose-phosphate 3-epimerase [Clostridium botulinum]AUM88477.1 ribulose-phosphate 3-epimerase [Clostridium botulinum]